MSDNYFLANEPAPDPAAIAKALGENYALYERLMAASEGFEKDWKHYGRKYGWKMKAHDGEKALFELTVCAAEIRLSLAARESEVAQLREDPIAAAVLAEILPPGAAKEGWGLRLSVAEEAGCGKAVALISALAAIRRDE